MAISETKRPPHRNMNKKSGKIELTDFENTGSFQKTKQIFYVGEQESKKIRKYGKKANKEQAKKKTVQVADDLIQLLTESGNQHQHIWILNLEFLLSFFGSCRSCCYCCCCCSDLTGFCSSSFGIERCILFLTPKNSNAYNIIVWNLNRCHGNLLASTRWCGSWFDGFKRKEN